MMNRISFVFCLCAVALACGCGSRSGASAARKGMAAFKEGRYPKAIEYFTSATERSDNSPELYYNLGLAYLAHGEMGDAQRAFQVALDLKPQEGEANILGSLAQAEYHQKAYTNALATLKRALALAPDDSTRVRILTVMGAVETCCLNYDLAHLYYLRALQLDRLYAPAQYNLALLYQNQFNLLQEALDSFQMFVNMPDLKDKDRRDKAQKTRIPTLRVLIDREASPNVRRDSARAASLLQEGVNAYVAKPKQYANAIRAYKAALAADPLTLSAAYGLGTVYREQGMHKDALDAFKTAIKINPTNQDFYRQAAELALQIKQPAEASKILSKAIARSPRNPMSARLMSQAAYDERRIPEAIAYGEYYLSLAPANDPGRAEYEKWVQTLKTRR